MLRFTTVFIFFMFEAGTATDFLQFPGAYYAKGTIALPYGDIAEPFEAWVNMISGNSRLDTYNGKKMSMSHGTWFGHGLYYIYIYFYI